MTLWPFYTDLFAKYEIRLIVFFAQNSESNERQQLFWLYRSNVLENTGVNRNEMFIEQLNLAIIIILMINKYF